jgi:regulator of sirC expression with transglutaminase-like and TPR domain
MPQDVASMVGRGVARVWREQWDEGINDLTAAIDVSTVDGPQTASAHRARGVAYAARGRNAEAITDYEVYLSIVPDAPDRARVEQWIDGLRAPKPPA